MIRVMLSSSARGESLSTFFTAGRTENGQSSSVIKGDNCLFYCVRKDSSNILFKGVQ